MSVVELRSRAAPTGVPEPSEEDVASFRTAMRHLAGAVAVVTTGTGEARTGFTATSVSSFSMDPPTLIVCLNRAASSWPVVQQHGGFCVNLLAHDQSHIADRFAGRGGVRGARRYEGASWQKQPSGALGLVGALVNIDCTLDDAIERHTHAILLGRVNAVTARSDAEPLLYWHGAYRLLSNLDLVLTRA